ncbi:MAG: apolipoprotein N-acyltransferase, partial [Pseudomonadota bacterium]
GGTASNITTASKLEAKYDGIIEIDELRTVKRKNSDGKIVGRYDKRALAPSEEFFVPGKDAKVFPTKHGKIGILICYESTLPYYSRELVNNGADYLFFLANDAGFGQSLEPYLHLNMAILRAVENHVFVVRAANTGISAVIDPNGRIVSKGTLNKKLVVHGKIHANYEPSIYSRFGDWFPPGCFILLCIACIPIMKTRLTIQGFFENPRLYGLTPASMAYVLRISLYIFGYASVMVALSIWAS